jgi:hypothetical protein
VARPGSQLTAASWLLGGAVLGPTTILIAALGTRAGLWSADFGLDALTFLLAPALTAVGAICAIVLAMWSMGRRRSMALAAIAAVLAVGGTAAGLFLRWDAFHGMQAWDVTSDAEDVPGFSRLLASRRAGDGAAAATSPSGSQSCAGAVSVPSQLAPQAAVAALEDAGFTVIGSAPFRAEGERSGFWFGLSHDAVVRIRPGRTDLRVTARNERAQGDETCRLASALSRALAARSDVQPGE